MGMYTGLKGKITIKEDKRDDFLSMLSSYYNNEHKCWSRILGEHKWLGYGRNEFIPFGALSYMPCEWDNQERKYNLSTGEFEFACSLKNYEGEIEFFLSNVLPEIADSWELEELYEEDEQPTLHIKESKDD